jgi:hypothetical protein
MSRNQEPLTLEEIAAVLDGPPLEGESCASRLGAEYNAADEAKKNQTGEK